MVSLLSSSFLRGKLLSRSNCQKQRQNVDCAVCAVFRWLSNGTSGCDSDQGIWGLSVLAAGAFTWAFGVAVETQL